MTLLAQVTRALTKARVLRTQNYMQQTRAAYIGCQVAETLPGHKTVRGIISDMKWDDSVGLGGEWCTRVLFENGLHTWTGWRYLEVIGSK